MRGWTRAGLAALAALALAAARPAAARVSVVVGTAAQANARLDELRVELKAAVDAHDGAALAAVRAQLDSLAATVPGAAAGHYWVAVADWRLAELALLQDTLAAARRAAQGVGQLDRALGLKPDTVEALALRGGLKTVQALAAKRARERAELENAARADIDRALTLAPRNPRAWLFEALATLRRRGADSTRAGPRASFGIFSKAQEMFAAAPPPVPGAPDWGWDDAYLWAGQAAMQLRNFQFAHLMLSRALEMNPHNDWVRHHLLPAAADSLRVPATF
jgi:tetratricopeptide (TPR) repeat protein